MWADHKLVRARRHECYDGRNVGYRPPPPIGISSAYDPWFNSTEAGKYRESDLWKRKLENRNIHVETYQCYDFRVGFITTKRTCNPATRTCTSIPYCGSVVADKIWSACTSSALTCADNQARAHFDADPTVQLRPKEYVWRPEAIRR